MSILVGKTSSLRPRTKIVKIINCNKSLNFAYLENLYLIIILIKKVTKYKLQSLNSIQKIYKNGKKINIPPDKVTDLFTNF